MRRWSRHWRDDCPAGMPHLLVWDNAPPHHTHAARDAAAAAGITIGWLPFRAPELNPCEDIWREMKRVVAANRAYADVDEQRQRAVAWLDDRTRRMLFHASPGYNRPSSIGCLLRAVCNC